MHHHQTFLLIYDISTPHRQAPLKELKRKGMHVKTDEPDSKVARGIKPDVEPSKTVKSEGVKMQAVKKEPGSAEQSQQLVPSAGPIDRADTPEALKSKDELIALHKLRKLEQNSNGKKFPVQCDFCDTIFEGRNRAKIYQHTRGLEHRRKWSASLHATADPVADAAPMDEVSNGVTRGTCKGLRLKSAFGKQTRLGSHMFEVWQEYVQFAHLTKADGPTGNACHSVVQVCNTNDWIIQSAGCQKENVTATCILFFGEVLNLIVNNLHAYA